MRWLWILAIILVIVPFAAATELTDYGNVTSYYYNITAGMGTQTDYQVKFILSNSSGVSGYYAPDNIIYTNGTTNATWFDVNATDESDNPLPFWIENNTATAHNATAWVKVPSIAEGNTSVGKWYYGAPAQNGSTMNGLNTFIFFDDFLGNSLNTTKWQNGTSEATLTISNGYIQIDAVDTTLRTILSKPELASSINRTIITRTKTLHYDASPSVYESIVIAGVTNWTGAFPNYVNRNRVFGNRDGSGAAYETNVSIPSGQWSADTYYILSIQQMSDRARYTTNYNATYTDITTHYPYKTSPSPYANITYNVNFVGARVTTDWVFAAKSVDTPPTTSLYTTSSTGSGNATLSASFTHLPEPSSVGQAVVLTDTSTGTPVTWNWTIDGVLTNSTQNAAYIFSAAGSYPIFLNVTNATGAWSNTSATHTVVNASGYTPQDVWMEGQYNITVHVTDSSTGAQLGNVTISTSDGQSATTNSLGYAYITEAFGVYVFYFSKEGYSSKSVSVAVDEDDTLDVQMTEAASTNNQQNTWYTPHQVRFRVFDGNNAPVVGTAVCATAISSTFPSGSDISWLTDMYGINPDMANEMLNGTLIMSGTTQSDGSTVFTMHSSIGYDIDVTNPANGVVQSVNVTPIDNYYMIHLVGSAVNNTYMQMGYNTTLNVTEPNSSFVTCNLFYQDMSASTTLVELYFIDRSNNTLLDYQSEVPVGSGWVWLNYTIPNVRGNRYSCYYNAMRTK